VLEALLSLLLLQWFPGAAMVPWRCVDAAVHSTDKTLRGMDVTLQAPSGRYK
jgi:hypothetical protein